jgi:hypothetical protein
VPSERPDIFVLCERLPVVVKVVAIDAYAVLAVVSYLQVAFSSVVSESVVCVVPEESALEGEPAERVGGVVSAAVVKVLSLEVEVLPKLSEATMAK